MAHLLQTTLWLARQLRQPGANPADYRQEWGRRHAEETGHPAACERGSWSKAQRSARRWNRERAARVTMAE